MKFARTISYLALLAALVLGVIGAGPAPAPKAPAAPPTFVVNSLGDAVAAAPLGSGPCETATGNGLCTLRAAIMKANHWPGGGAAISLPAGVYALLLAPTGGNDETSGDLNVTASLTLTGAGAASTIVDGNALDRVLLIGAGVTVTVSNITIRNGDANAGGGFFNGGALTLNRVNVSGNRSPFNAGGLQNGGTGTLTLNRSLVSGNVAAGGSGGGIINDGALILDNSTVSNNSASSYGGGLANYGTANVYFSTIAGNVADSDGGGGDQGGGIFTGSGSSLTLRASLLADNFNGQAASQCDGPITSQGYNLLQTIGTCAFTGVTTGNQYGLDPLLLPLQANGGPTLTRALQAGSLAQVGSPAINAIPTAQCLDRFSAPLTSDQRGSARPADGACDVGAYEGSAPASLFYRNLIRNGDAEAGAGSPDGAHVGAPSWQQETSYVPTVVTYGAPGFPTLADPGPPARGVNFFAGGNGGDMYDTNTLSQTISVASIASAIDAGEVSYELSGYFGGKGALPDYAILIVHFSNGVTEITSFFIGGVTPSSRGDATALQFRRTSGTVPAGTTDIFVRLRFFKAGSGYNDGYADNLSLVLSRPPLYLPLILR